MLIDTNLLLNVLILEFLERWVIYKETIFGSDGKDLNPCLAQNIPFICFWPDTKKQINPSLLYKFEFLKKAGVYFDNEKDLITHINNTWNKVEDWWNNPSTQNNIDMFNKDLNLKPNNEDFQKFSSFLSSIKDFDPSTKTDDIYPIW